MVARMVGTARAWGIAAIGIACACAPDTSGLGGGDSAAPVDPSSTGTSEGPVTSTGDPETTSTTGQADDTPAATTTGDPPSDGTTTDAPGDSTDTGVEPKQVEHCASPNLAILDDDPTGVSSTIEVPELGTIVDLRVLVQADHAFIGDLRVALLGGTGGQVAIIDRPDDDDSRYEGGCGGVNIDAELHDAAPVGVDGTCFDGANPGLVGEVRPDVLLGPTFVGQPMNGSWRLHVVDAAPNDTGTLLSWCLRVTYE